MIVTTASYVSHYEQDYVPLYAFGALGMWL